MKLFWSSFCFQCLYTPCLVSQDSESFTSWRIGKARVISQRHFGKRRHYCPTIYRTWSSICRTYLTKSVGYFLWSSKRASSQNSKKKKQKQENKLYILELHVRIFWNCKGEWYDFLDMVELCWIYRAMNGCCHIKTSEASTFQELRNKGFGFNLVIVGVEFAHTTEVWTGGATCEWRSFPSNPPNSS